MNFKLSQRKPIPIRVLRTSWPRLKAEYRKNKSDPGMDGQMMTTWSFWYIENKMLQRTCPRFGSTTLRDTQPRPRKSRFGPCSIQVLNSTLAYLPDSTTSSKKAESNWSHWIQSTPQSNVPHYADNLEQLAFRVIHWTIGRTGWNVDLLPAILGGFPSGSHLDRVLFILSPNCPCLNL